VSIDLKGGEKRREVERRRGAEKERSGEEISALREVEICRWIWRFLEISLGTIVPYPEARDYLFIFVLFNY
jgi:hypothetical protein